MAAENQYHGLAIDTILTDNTALPNATSAYTSDFELTGKTGNRLRVVFYANTDITVATDKAFSIELLAGTSENPTTTPIDDAHVYLINKTSADGEMTFSDGDLIASYVIDEALLGTNNHIRFKITTDADLSSYNYSAFVTASL